MSDYKDTLNLPKTGFPMRANLNQREPETLAFWEQSKAYETMVSTGGEKGPYVLHDGPPYANGHIHLGTALNKVIKDIIVKSMNMQGFHAEYVPGWDCHGLPIEHKVEQELGGKKGYSALDIRKRCREFASKWLDIQREEFKRLGVFGVWDNPYLTMRPAYEAATAGELCRFMARGQVMRSKKPIHWCMSCETALAEAEVEYADHKSPSIYVRFPLPDPALTKLLPQADPARTSIVIWTTTPWTIPDNMAVAVHPEFDYVLVKSGEEFLILAKELVEAVAKAVKLEAYEILAECKGQDLEGLVARHPFYERDSRVVLGDHVTLEAGTGCVHTAPGHGREDYDTGLRYGLEILSPLDDQGRFLLDVDYFSGLTVFEANPKVIEKLEETGRLLGRGNVTHSYPHCWRCKKPVIFRATTQWFISMEKNNLRQRALDAIKNDVRWIPAWGQDRIYSMIEHRPDWCISRQRNWGVPIVALRCQDCDEAWWDAEWCQGVVEHFKEHEHGCDWWFEADMADIVPEGLTCPKCGRRNWRRETDILDVWFDSGTSYAAVCEQRPECTYPATMYLEGTDQHRGWFHSSLLASVGTRDKAPYKEVLTHGYVVDGDGYKMSKSIGNVVAPQEIIDKFGAEILRLWVSSVDYREDIRVSDEILSRLVDAYRRIRNTARFLLSNLGDFAPADAVPLDNMLPLDRMAMDIALRANTRIQQAYTDYEFHKVFHTLHNLCVTDLSAFYLDCAKDRLYVEGKTSLERRSAQTAVHRLLEVLLRGMAPILSFTAEEVFKHLPEALKPELNTVFGLKALDLKPVLSDEERRRFEKLQEVRGVVTRAIEPLRKSGELGHSLDSWITLYAEDELRQDIEALGVDLREAFIVSKAGFAPLAEAPADAFGLDEMPGLKIGVRRAPGAKCQRCWMYSEELGTLEGHPEACPRCSRVLASL